MIAFSLSLFYYFILVPVHKNMLLTLLVPFTDVEFILFVLSVVTIAAAGNIINDYFDFEADKEYKPDRPLATGAISLNTALYLHAVLAFVGIGLGFYLGWDNNHFKIGYLYVTTVLLLYLYSAYLKNIPLLGNILVAGLTGFVFVLLLVFEANYLQTINLEGGQYVFTVLMLQVKFYASFAFLTNLAREIVKDLEDREGDETYKVNTLPVQFGEGVGKTAVVIVLFILLGVLSVLMKGLAESKAFKELIYLLVTVAVPVAVIAGWLISAKEKQQYARISLSLKVIMLLGILSIPAFYFFSRL